MSEQPRKRRTIEEQIRDLQEKKQAQDARQKERKEKKFSASLGTTRTLYARLNAATLTTIQHGRAIGMDIDEVIEAIQEGQMTINGLDDVISITPDDNIN